MFIFLLGFIYAAGTLGFSMAQAFTRGDSFDNGLLRMAQKMDSEFAPPGIPMFVILIRAIFVRDVSDLRNLEIRMMRQEENQVNAEVDTAAATLSAAQARQDGIRSRREAQEALHQDEMSEEEIFLMEYQASIDRTFMAAQTQVQERIRQAALARAGRDDAAGVAGDGGGTGGTAEDLERINATADRARARAEAAAFGEGGADAAIDRAREAAAQRVQSAAHEAEAALDAAQDRAETALDAAQDRAETAVDAARHPDSRPPDGGDGGAGSSGST